MVTSVDYHHIGMQCLTDGDCIAHAVYATEMLPQQVQTVIASGACSLMPWMVLHRRCLFYKRLTLCQHCKYDNTEQR